jgi:hypothetical protein
VALLKGYSLENKDVVRTAVDILVPCLPIRMPQDEFVRTIKWTKKLLMEETHSPQNLMHILQVIVRHPDVYYSYRHQLIPQMITSMSRIGLPHNAAIENRIVALNVADVLINWEWCRLRRKLTFPEEAVPESSNKRSFVHTDGSLPMPKMMRSETAPTGSANSVFDSPPKVLSGPPSLIRSSTAPVSGTGPTNPLLAFDERDHERTLTHIQIHLVANFIIRLGSLACESKEGSFSRLSTKCSNLFKKMVGVYPFQGIKLNYFEKLLAGVADQHSVPRKDGITGKDASSNAAQTGSSVSAASSSSSSTKTPNLSEASLTFFLEVQLATLECMDGPSSLLIQNVPIVLGLCSWAMTSKSFAIHSVFRALVTKVFQLYPAQAPHPALVDYGFYPKLRELLDKQLKLEHENPPSTVATQPPQVASPDRHSLFLSFMCIDDIIKIYPDWINNHAHTVVNISTSLLSDHIGRATKSSLKATDMSFFPSHAPDIGQDFSIFSAQPLASTAIFADYISNDGIHSSFGAGHVTNTPNSVSSLIHTRLTSISHNCSTCALGISLLVKSLHQGLLSHYRQSILTLIVSVLEGSDNPYFLFYASQVCNAWIARPRSPLTALEQWYLYTRVVGAFDRFPDYSAHPYMLRLACVSERMGRWLECNRTQFNYMFGPGMKQYPCDGIGLIGVSSALPAIQFQCLRRYSKALGHGSLNMLFHLFKTDISALSMRFIPVVLQSLILLNTHSDELQLAVKRYATNGGRDAGMAVDDHGTEIFVTFASKYSPSFVEPLKEYFDVSTSTLQSVTADLVDDICSVSLLHGRSTEQFWRQYMKLLWSRLNRDQQTDFVTGLESFLLANRFRKFDYFPAEAPGIPLARNVPQWFIDSMVHLEPMPIFSCLFLTSMHNYYGIGCSIGHYLERLCEYGTLRSNHRLSNSAVVTAGAVYKSLKERAMLLSLYRMFTSHEITDAMLSLELHDKYFEAHQNLSECINRHCKVIKESSSITSTTGNNVGYLYYSKDKDNTMTLFDLEVWQERWVATAQNLSKWGILLDVSQQQHVPELALECAAVKCDWESIRKLRIHPTNVAGLENGLLNTKLIDVMMCIVENRFNDVEKLCAQSVQLALSNWQKSPPLCTGSTLHKAAFNCFHRVVELRESNVVMVEAFRASKDKDKNMPDIKSTLKNWRLRLCETSYFTQSMDPLMEWRLYIFNAVKSIYQNTPGRDPGQSSTLVDTTWTLLSNARYYRKQRLPEVSLLSFHRLRAITSMEVSDIFTKIREQVLLSYSPVNAHMLAGLHLINTTNLDFFTPFQKAELFRLKAQLLLQLEKPTEANEMFAHSVQVHQQHDRAWLNWANYCFDVISQSCSLSFNGSSSQNVSTPVIDVMQAARVVVCMLKAIEGNSIHAKQLLPRVLWLVRYADDNARTLTEKFAAHSSHLPACTWIPVIRTMIDAAGDISHESKGRADIYLVPLIAKVAVAYPNVVAYELLSRSQSPAGKPANASSTLCRLLLNQLKASHSSGAQLVDMTRALTTTLKTVLDIPVVDHCRHIVSLMWSEIVSRMNFSLESMVSTSQREILVELQQYLLQAQQTKTYRQEAPTTEMLIRCHAEVSEVLMTDAITTGQVYQISVVVSFLLIMAS